MKTESWDNMKYGLILYKETDNLGDDIQSYAAMQISTTSRVCNRSRSIR